MFQCGMMIQKNIKITKQIEGITNQQNLTIPKQWFNIESGIEKIFKMARQIRS
jgi:hypothetical protein